METKSRIIGVSLASMAGLLLVSGVAWAQASKTPLAGTVPFFVVIDAGDIWLDDDGVRHFRDRRTRVRFEGDITGPMFRIASLNVNTLTREADGHGSFTFTGVVLGELFSATGRFAFSCSGQPSICEEDTVWHLEDGRKINLIERYPLDTSEYDYYEGTLLDPPGR